MKKSNTVKTYAVVIGIVKHKTKILLLKRTLTRTISPGKWQTVSGFIGEREAAEDAVLREVKEETGLTGKIVLKAKTFEITDKFGRWIEIPFLVTVKNDKTKIDPNEHSDFIWIKPKEINKFACVKGTKEDLVSVGLLK
jgi:8-oxo-dGTP diphosphatase